jgi:hypothetical protein
MEIFVCPYGVSLSHITIVTIKIACGTGRLSSWVGAARPDIT